jgi:beta-phosphoglucomutase-like phosphatase (HAD superfamily)
VSDSRPPRQVVTPLDMLRARIDHESFDAAIFTLETVAADLGYGDVRPLPGSIAWIDRLREDDKRIAVTAAGERLSDALEIARIADRFDVVVVGVSPAERLAGALEELGLEAGRVVVAAVEPPELEAARAAGVELAIGVARGSASPEQLRRAGVLTVVADLQELLLPGVG